MMNFKHIPLVLLFISFLIACNDDNAVKKNQSSSSQEASSLEQKTSALPVKTKVSGEPTFNKAKVRSDYKDTPLRVLDVSERNVDGKNVIAVTLSVPLDPAINFQRYLRVTSKNKAVDGAWIISNSGKTLWFPFVDPDTNYRVVVHHGLEAGNGQKLATTDSAQVTTSRLESSVNFDTTGAFLTQGLGNGLPVVAVNTDEVDINFYRIKEKSRHHFLQEIADHRYYWGMDRITQFGDLVYSGRYALDVPKNTRAKRSIDMGGVSELNQPGIYLAVMAQAGKYDKHQTMWFSITDIGLHARFYQKQLDVYASSLVSGKPLEQVDVSLVDRQGVVLQQTSTSPNGEASFDGNLNDAALIVAQNDHHFSLIEINKPALDLSEFDLGLRPNRAQELFIYAPRDLYRPGEVIDFNGLLRDQDGRMVKHNSLSAVIKSPDGTKVKSFQWQGDEQNYFHYQWQIPASAPVGTWQLEVSNLGRDSFSFAFKVEEFLPERLKLTFNPKATAKRTVIGKGEQFQLPVLGEYLYGAPAAGNRLSTQVSTSLWRNPVESLADFEFGDIKQGQFNSREELKDIELDSQGQGTITYQNDWAALTSPLRVRFISSLYESGGRPVSRVHSGLVWPKEQLLGIRPHFGDSNPDAHSTVSFDVVKASLAGNKYAATNLDIKLIREDRRYFWVYSESQGWHYQWTDNEYVELTSTLDIAQDEIGEVKFPVSWGRYRLEVREPALGLSTSVQFYAGENWYEDWQNSQSGNGAARPDKVALALDKAAYQVGDTVKVNVVPPQAGEAIIMVEGDSPLFIKRQFIPAQGATIEIPVAGSWQQHNLYISALVLQPGDNIKTITPKRSFGLIHLPLARENRQLQVNFDVPDKVLPNSQLEVKLSVTGELVSTVNMLSNEARSKVQPVFVTVAAVDVGVLSVSDFTTPNPFEAFFGQRRYQVDSRDVYHQVIEMSLADKARLRFGGDSDLNRGGKAPQSEVQIVSLFSGVVAVNDDGTANIPLKLPDFNGKIRLMAVAFSADKFGHGEQEVTVAAPVVTQIAMPRFLALGDKTTVALDVTNLSGSKQDLAVNFTGQGSISTFYQSQMLTLDDGQKTTLFYPVEATSYQGQARFSLSLSSESLQLVINRDWALGMRPAYPATFTKVQKLLKQGQSLSLDPKHIEPLLADTIQVSLNVSSRADIDLQSQLNHLLQYPYGCLEQTSSRAYPLILATPSKQKLAGIKPVAESKRLSMINKGIERLAMLQLSNGGYGLWSNTSPEEHWLTVYVADFLLNARDMGVGVPNEMLDKTLKRLQRYLSRSGRFYNERWSDDQDHYNFAYKAYAAYVLSRVNQAPLGTLRTLALSQSKHARSGLAQTHLAVALTKMGDHKLAQSVLAKALTNLPRKRQAYLADYGSQIRDYALMIDLMLSHKLEPKKAISMSFTLADLLRQRQYLSTQERNALFLAGISLKDFDGAIWAAEILIGSAQTKLNQSASYQSNLAPDALTQAISIRSDHNAPLLANFNISGYAKSAPQAMGNGLSVNRRWYTVKGETANLNEAKVGDLYLVHLVVNAEQRTPDALLVDLIPAGFELENQNLAHSIKLDSVLIDGKTIPQWTRYNHIKHQEYRDDRFVAALEVSKRRSSHLFYLMRAVTPGEYQVPSVLVEDMYRPEIRAIGKPQGMVSISQRP
ncbi:alpha-2-macroglobulin [Psychrobium sp. 1_MG-2023]|uniref:alpha-2-macroglobulin family protein n=1 Tax=Psychrobium sp. 1_MG-2023 TaxID=3062624 RepID=UPI000C343743|nr:alpha-2-macroglobulin [Psychrobium sp. 1_MG-2023]MDP2561354.1 alpha-2-macroglobulin [Psychrobium sp. 1_MG-2023]PKF54167.1 alpha-2-macroglobulin [Alteromonadales bacterium alter-6D02]